ncbi:MAG: hypothetical protein COA74_16000 [Gammaproteobacteria bacterium]|nr:MAG: hypothetical protein COA74_16000 [Gammaproteobacteria bacterium]
MSATVEIMKLGKGEDQMNNIKIVIYCGLISLALCSITGTANATEKEAKEKKLETPTIKYSNLKKPKAISTGDKVYTWIDDSGNRMYSDTPRDGAELMKIEEGTNYTPPNQDGHKNYSEMKPKIVPTAFVYNSFAIVSPANDQTIRNNNGDFQVAIDIRPKLASGHKLRLEIDGQLVQNSNSSFISLANVDRGTHTLIAYIVSADNKTLKATRPVIIHLHRTRQ